MTVFEEEFEMLQDPSLHRAGVKMVARVEGSSIGLSQRVGAPMGAKWHNRIIFRRVMSGGDVREGTVTCVHTAVGAMAVEDLPAVDGEVDQEALVEYARTTEGNPVDLPGEEHFFALKSYVAGIAEMGLMRLMAASYYSDDVNPETLPFGFNSAMHRQMSIALSQVAPRETVWLLENLWEELKASVPASWLRPRIKMLREMYGLDDLKKQLDRDELQERREAVIAAYGPVDGEMVNNIWDVEVVSYVDTDTGRVVERNRVFGIPPRAAGHPVSVGGWAVRAERWGAFQSLRLPARFSFTGTWWEKMDEPWAVRVGQAVERGGVTMRAAIQYVIMMRHGGGNFLKSLYAQLARWVLDPEPKWATPFSANQVNAVLRIRAARRRRAW